MWTRSWNPALSFLFAVVVALPATGRAQVCAGLPSLNERPIIGTLDASFARDASSASVGATVGRTMFGAGYVGTVAYQDVSFAAQTGDASSTVFGAGLGYEFRLAREQEGGGVRAGLCPVVTGEWETGPDGDFSGTPLNGDGWTVGAGLSLGARAWRRGAWRLLPYAAASYVRVAATIHDFPFSGTDTEGHDDGWVFSFGVGVGMGPRLTISPVFTAPAGISGGERSVGVSVNYGLGQSRE